MSDMMRPMSFARLLDWTLTEHKKYGTIFGARHAYRADEKYARSIFGRRLETPIGPAAGLPTPSLPRISWRHITRAAGSLS